MAGLSEVTCAGSDGPCPFAAGSGCDDGRMPGCHCLCFDPCDEECGHQICAQWHAWFDSLPDDQAREIIRVYWVEPMKTTLAEALIEVAGGEESPSA